MSNQFQLNDRQKLFGFIERHPFGVLTTPGENGAVHITSLPFVLDESRMFIHSHVVKRNPHYPFLLRGSSHTVTFVGPNCYVSPDWTGNPDLVPTWNYVTVSVCDPVFCVDGEEASSLLSKQVKKFEGDTGGTWNISRLDAERFENLFRAIRVFKLAINKFEGIAKLSQTRPIFERKMIISALQRCPDCQSRSIAHLMEREISDAESR